LAVLTVISLCALAALHQDQEPGRTGDEPRCYLVFSSDELQLMIASKKSQQRCLLSPACMTSIFYFLFMLGTTAPALQNI
jgi:hypothetical protein